jgi:hypothetical protein
VRRGRGGGRLTPAGVWQIYHIEIPTSSSDELQVAKVAARLAKAGGANYDKNQNQAGVDDDSTQFTSYKGQVCTRAVCERGGGWGVRGLG